MKSPLVSVVLPIYNAEKYLKETLISISEQTFTDWELIAINDGSTDNSEQVLKEFAKNEPRLKIISRENKGLIATLNEGISVAKGEWIARIDADDICLPDRFKRQLEWVERTGADICGGIIERIGQNAGNSWVFPGSTEGIYLWLLFRSAFAHPTIIMKRQVALKFQYSADYIHAEDYELWTRLALAEIKMTNIPEKVLLYRIHPDQVSTDKKDHQIKTRVKVTREYWAKSELTRGLEFLDCLVDERKGISRNDFHKIIAQFKILETRLTDSEAKKALSCHLTWFLYRSIQLGGKTVIPAIKDMKMSFTKKLIISVLAIFKAQFLISHCRNAAWIRWLPLKWFF
jgi:glycosyltransferase involved in cell wall biosynthesis